MSSAAVVAASLALCSASIAGLVPVSQKRVVDVSATVLDFNFVPYFAADTRTAPGFAPFNENISVSAVDPNTTVTAESRQLSTIGASSVSLSERVGYAISGLPHLSYYPNPVAASDFDLVFTVSTTGTWYVSGSFWGTVPAFSTPYGSFAGSSLALFNVVTGATVFQADDTNPTIPPSAVLSAGTYELLATCVLNHKDHIIFAPESAAFGLDFEMHTVPAPGAIGLLGLLGLGAMVRRRSAAC